MDASRILAIETSCDETAAAVIEDGVRVRASRVHSQVDLHAAYGGVVPELASRDHLARLMPVVDATLADAELALEDLSAVAVTAGPGLIGPLLVGVQTAKGLALATGRPLAGVNHLEGHLAAVRLEPDPPEPPYLGLVVSGGHTSLYRVEGGAPPRYRVLGRTRDDAAGEAFDKTARLLGLPYPGGRVLDERAEGGDPAALPFPRGLRGRGLDLSFSGLKTSVRHHVEAHGVPEEGAALSDLCASVQEAIVDPLVEKSFAALEAEGLDRLLVCGGVAANRRLRTRLAEHADRAGVGLWIPSPKLCTDNAAMIGAAAYPRLLAGEAGGLELEPDPGWSIG